MALLCGAGAAGDAAAVAAGPARSGGVDAVLVRPVRRGRRLCVAGGSGRGGGAAGAARAMRGDPLFATERQQFLNSFGETGIVLGTADAFIRMGEVESAVWLTRNAVAKHPKDTDLRIGYAHALQVMAQGNLTPAVQLAFDQADAVA